MLLAVFYVAHKGIIFLMLPLICEGLADTKGLISIHYIRLDMYLVVKPLEYVITYSMAWGIAMVRYIPVKPIKNGFSVIEV